MFPPVVYFIRDGIGNIKIGRTSNLPNRIAAIQTSNPNKLEYYFGVSLKDDKETDTLEKYLHKKFSASRKIGEWFDEREVLMWLNSAEELEAGGFRFKSPLTL